MQSPIRHSYATISVAFHLELTCDVKLAQCCKSQGEYHTQACVVVATLTLGHETVWLSRFDGAQYSTSFG